MTGREFGGLQPADLGLPGHDVDLLADYLAGALRGTPAQIEVARRIRDDADWAAAASALESANAEVTATLVGWGQAAEQMPLDIAERISAALAHASADPTGSGTPADNPDTTGTTGTIGSPPERAGGLSVVPGGAKDRPRRRWAGWNRPLAAAAAVLAFLGFGLWALPQIRDAAERSSSDAGVSAPRMLDERDGSRAGGPATGQKATDLAQPPVRRMIASGLDYRRQALRDRSANAAPFAVPEPTGPEPTGPAEARGQDRAELAPEKTPAALRRLVPVTALRACLAAIGTEHAPPATAVVQLVDYASFEGSPALVVVFVDAAGARWVWAAGPRCGLPGVGADTRYRAAIE